MSELSKVFEHTEVDPRWYGVWEARGAFTADPASGKPPFSMVIPPPNVTGYLHIGHALNQTLPDVIIRWKRMQGYDVLWLPGTDHAGIATQNVVEKQLAKEGKTRHDLGREAFEARVWEWVRFSRSGITGQMRKLGSSVDWTRERFTLDPGLSSAVRRVFVSLYEEGLIYRGRSIINWCPRCSTALSDLEVVHKPVSGTLTYIRYPYAEGEGHPSMPLGVGPSTSLGAGPEGIAGHVTVATTRPETMLGDTAVAVHPEDERFAHLIGRHVRLPVIGRLLPVIADAFVDPAFGTGVVKVTPAHDPNDFAMGQRHDLEQVQVIGEDGRMTAAAGPYADMDRFKARTALVAQLEREGLIEKAEAHQHAVGHCDRCGTVVEPLISWQWFVAIKPLAEEAIRAVEDGRIQFTPENWTKTYFEWMRNIHDWCISRQLWWGHRIPAWYCDRCGTVIVTEGEPSVCACGGPLRQETDVLDTWFSSGLWPFSTMGWPEDTPDRRRYYPTSLLITGFDIIFFWVARMIMFGLKFTGDVPFRQLYITSLVRDAQGQKMSKSKGNVVDPLEVMEEIGADAFRFTLANLASPGMDISLSEGRLRASRQFINKIWNASRFVLLNVADVAARPAVPAQSRLLVNRWILHAVNRVTAEVDRLLTEFRFDQAADALRRFFWHEYADWYIELVKPHLSAGAADRGETVAVLLEVHDRILRLLHPITPFITEEIWQKLPRRADAGDTITLAAFPAVVAAWHDDQAAAEFTLVQEVVTAIRTARSERGVPPARRLAAFVEGADARERELLSAQAEYVRRLAGLDAFEFADRVERSPDTVRRIVGTMQVHVPLAGVVDRDAERDRVRKELAGLEKQKGGLSGKLGNPMFRERADPDVVRETEQQLRALDTHEQQLRRILAELDA